MAKKSTIAREHQRKQTAEKYRAKREAIKEQLSKAYIEAESGDDDGEIGMKIMELQMQLQSLPRNSSRSRQRNRCRLTGRPHGVYRKFGLGRNKLREYAMMGAIPGLKKASW